MATTVLPKREKKEDQKREEEEHRPSMHKQLQKQTWGEMHRPVLLVGVERDTLS